VADEADLAQIVEEKQRQLGIALIRRTLAANGGAPPVDATAGDCLDCETPIPAERMRATGNTAVRCTPCQARWERRA